MFPAWTTCQRIRKPKQTNISNIGKVIGKKSSQRKARTRKLHCEVPLNINEEPILIPFKLFSLIEDKGIPPNTFCSINTTLMHAKTRGRHSNNNNKHNYRSIYLISVDAKILSKVLVKQIQQHIKKMLGMLGLERWLSD